jgi:hypothetical protein
MDMETAKQELLSVQNSVTRAIDYIESGDATAAKKAIDRMLSYLADAKTALQ